MIDEAVSRAADAMDVFIDDGIDLVMNRYNRKEDSEDKEEQEQV